MDLAFIRKMLGSGLCGCFCTLPAYLPCNLASFLSLGCHPMGVITHRELGYHPQGARCPCYVHQDVIGAEKLGCDTQLTANSNLFRRQC